MSAKKTQPKKGNVQLFFGSVLNKLPFLRRLGVTMKRRVRDLMARRPHRSFRRTMRRDYVRSLKLPGYWSFTNDVRRLLVKNKKLFLGLIAIYAVLSGLLIGLASQSAYMTVSETLHDTGSEIFSGNWGEIGKASLLLIAGMSGGYSGQLSESQQIYAVILSLLSWLTTVWLLRALLAGGRPKLREGIYSSGAPILSTFGVSLVIVLQLLPVALATLALGAAMSTGLLDAGGIEAMLFWVLIVALGGLSLYWITSTAIALVVVTLPGMYPMKAIKTAGDLVVGRRLRILLRLLWLLFTVALAWVLIMVPAIIFDAWLKGVTSSVDWLPIVPIFMLILSSFTIIWIASYVYLLYRRVVDDDASPA